MNINLFDYKLPEQLIAQYPQANRQDSRLMVLNRLNGEIEVKVFNDIIDYFNPGDCIVVNNTKVFKARLLGNRKSGGEVEIFLVRRIEADTQKWFALAQPSKRLNENEVIYFDHIAGIRLLKNLGGGQWQLEFRSQSDEVMIIDKFGHVPLPQYIKRTDTTDDVARYQTIFAKDELEGAVAAPTAGFHFSNELIEKVRAKGVYLAELTLHVGPGTFKPVTADHIDDHIVDPEYAILDQQSADKINQTRNSDGKVIAVGTTVVRTLESAEIVNNQIEPFEGFVDLYIKPGHKFKSFNRLISNFHLPKSSLLILVSALAGRENILKAYKEAIECGFRFYSYGDAMLIL
jgi:S-adenosylmethionine:tRNA ribosyltransferase-isomerase